MLSVAVYFYNKAKQGIELKLSTIISFKMILLVLVSYLLLGTLWAAVAGRLGDKNVFETFESIIQNGNSMVTDRLVNGENRPLYAIYGMVPKNYDYFLGQTFPNPLRLLPFEPVPLSYLVYDEVHPGGDVIEGVRGAAPTTFFSVIYANFGIIVSFISMYLFGFIVQWLNDKLLYNEKYIIPYRFVWMNYVTLFATSIDIPFLSEKVLILVAVYFLMYKRLPNRSVSIENKEGLTMKSRIQEQTGLSHG
jgi:hypothetical protein